MDVLPERGRLALRGPARKRWVARRLAGRDSPRREPGEWLRGTAARYQLPRGKLSTPAVLGPSQVSEGSTRDHLRSTVVSSSTVALASKAVSVA